MCFFIQTGIARPLRHCFQPFPIKRYWLHMSENVLHEPEQEKHPCLSWRSAPASSRYLFYPVAKYAKMAATLILVGDQ